MRFLLLFLLVLALSKNWCNAQCTSRPTGKKGCLKYGTLYHVGAVWKTHNCQRCECKKKLLICCSLIFKPTNYDKTNCIAMFHKPTCSIRVVKIKDPSVTCKVFAGVG